MHQDEKNRQKRRAPSTTNAGREGDELRDCNDDDAFAGNADRKRLIKPEALPLLLLLFPKPAAAAALRRVTAIAVRDRDT